MGPAIPFPWGTVRDSRVLTIGKEFYKCCFWAGRWGLTPLYLSTISSRPWKYSTWLGETYVTISWAHASLFWWWILYSYEIWFDLVNTTLVYTTPLILRHNFARPNLLVQNSIFYTTTTLDNATVRTPFCHIKDVVNAKIPFIYVMYI